MSGNWSSSWSSGATPQNTPSTDKESGNNSWGEFRPHHYENKNSWGAQPGFGAKIGGSWVHYGQGGSWPNNKNAPPAAYIVEANTLKSKAGNNGWSESDRDLLNLSNNMRDMNTNQDAHPNIPQHVQHCSRCAGWGCEECSLLIHASAQAENSGWGNVNNNVDQKSSQSSSTGNASICTERGYAGPDKQQQEINNSWGNSNLGDNHSKSNLTQNSQQANYNRTSNDDGWGGPSHGSWGAQNGDSAQPRREKNDNAYEGPSHGSWGSKVEAVYSRSGKTVRYKVNNSNASQPSEDEPETALATFPYEFTTVPKEYITGTDFKGLCNINPAVWPRIIMQNWVTENKNLSGWGVSAVDKMQWIKDVAREENGAAHLLLTIFWSKVLGSKSGGWGDDDAFWQEAFFEAVHVLFSFEGAPERYLGRVTKVNRKNKGHLKDIVAQNGRVFFTVDTKGRFTWLSEEEGFKLSMDVIGKLPPLELRVI